MLLLLLLLLAVVGQVEAIGALLPIVQLHAPALLANEVTHCSAVVLICLQAVVTHAKHFASEGLGHDSLPALSSGLRQDGAGPCLPLHDARPDPPRGALRTAGLLRFC